MPLSEVLFALVQYGPVKWSELWGMLHKHLGLRLTGAQYCKALLAAQKAGKIRRTRVDGFACFEAVK